MAGKMGEEAVNSAATGEHEHAQLECFKQGNQAMVAFFGNAGACTSSITAAGEPSIVAEIEEDANDTTDEFASASKSMGPPSVGEREMVAAAALVALHSSQREGDTGAIDQTADWMALTARPSEAMAANGGQSSDADDSGFTITWMDPEICTSPSADDFGIICDRPLKWRPYVFPTAQERARVAGTDDGGRLIMLPTEEPRGSPS